MIGRTIGAVSAFALFASVSAVAFAQGPGGGQGEERMQGPGQSTQQMAPGQQKSQQRGGDQAQTPQRSQGQAEQPDGKQQRQAEQPDRKQQKAEQPERKQQKQAEQPERKQQKQAEQPDRKQQKQAEQPDRKQQKAEQPDRKQQQKAEQPDREKQKQKQAERTERPRLSEQQRTTVRERIRESDALERARVANVNFNISVGTRVPRDRIKLAPLPAVIVEEVPAYRGYVYFVVQDEVVIVEPSTYVIVDVIRMDGTPSRAARTEARLTLTGEQRQFVMSHISMQPTVRLGIGQVEIGTTLPRGVEMRSFPRDVTAEIPELRQYRYIVFENDVAIVSPDQRRVVLTISQ